MKRKILIWISVVVMLSSFAFVTACGNGKPKQLDTPTVSVLENLIDWEDVSNATSYDIFVDGVLKTSVTESSYTFSGMAIGEYTVTVVAKSNNSERYLDSNASTPITYVAKKEFVRLQLVSEPSQTVYYLDENKAIDLTGLKVVAVYTNAESEEITFTAQDILSTYDMLSVGTYDIEFLHTGENGISSSVSFSIAVKQRTQEDVSEYAVIYNQITDAQYKIANTVIDSAYKMDGTQLTVSNDGSCSFVPANELAEGETLIKVGGEYTLVVVARYITNVEDFNAMINLPNGYYLLCNDIDFSEQTCVPVGRAPIAQNGESAGIDKTANAGVAFNGTFNGNGYLIKNFTYAGPEGYNLESFGLGLFGYLGANGKICNLTLRNVSISGSSHCALLVGYNLGTVENITVEENCSLYVHYNDGAVISAYNYGTVKNVVSYVDKCQNGYPDDDGSINIVRQEESYTVSAGVNGYICDSTDLTSVLGDGWTYINGYGTVYCNENYKKVLSADKEWTIGGEINITVWQKTTEEIFTAVWGAGASDVTTVLQYVSYDQATCTYTFTVSNSVTLTAGMELVVGIGIPTKGYFEIFTVTVQ